MGVRSYVTKQLVLFQDAESSSTSCAKNPSFRAEDGDMDTESGGIGAARHHHPCPGAARRWKRLTLTWKPWSFSMDINGHQLDIDLWDPSHGVPYEFFTCFNDCEICWFCSHVRVFPDETPDQFLNGKDVRIVIIFASAQMPSTTINHHQPPFCLLVPCLHLVVSQN